MFIVDYDLMGVEIELKVVVFDINGFISVLLGGVRIFYLLCIGKWIVICGFLD